MSPLPAPAKPLPVPADPQPRQPHPGVAVATPQRSEPCPEHRAVGGAWVEECRVDLVGEVFEDLPTLLNQPGYRARLLFPGDDAQPMQACAASDEPLLLVVPDGTWRKARKMLHLNPLLAALPRVTLVSGGVSRYRLRKAPGPGALSTVEAIVQALETLEAPTRFAPLLRPFEALIEGQIAAMGRRFFSVIMATDDVVCAGLFAQPAPTLTVFFLEELGRRGSGLARGRCRSITTPFE